jgi:hypothetical protein
MRSLKVLLVSIWFIIQAASFSNLHAQNLPNQKHVIGANPHGFFSNFLVTLGHLLWCDVNGQQPVVFWDKRFLYFEPEGWNNTQNAWEYYFDPVSSETYNLNDIIDYNGKAPNGFFFPWKEDFSEIEMLRSSANYIIKKYIKIKSFILETVNDFYDKNMKNYIVVGIHLRGSDKKSEAPTGINPLDIIKKAQKYAYLGASTGKTIKYLIASDEQGLIDFAQAELRKDTYASIPGEILIYPTDRAQGNKTNHLTFVGTKKENGFFAKRGLDVLIEVLLLSRCSYFVHTMSNVSTAVIFFNPNLIHYQFDGFAKLNENQKNSKNEQRKNKMAVK